MGLASLSRSAFSRTGTTMTMKPGVTTLSVGTIDITGITLDDHYSIDVDTTVSSPTQHELQFTNSNGTRTISFTEDIISGGVIKPELMPDRALTQLFDNLTGGTEQLQKDNLVTQTVQIGDVAIIYGITYINKTGNNETFSTDWTGLALAHDHDAVNVTSVLRGQWTAGYSHSTDNTNGVSGNPHGLNYTDVSAIPSVAGTFTPAVTNTVNLGTDSITMGTIYAKEFKFSNANFLPDQNWGDVYNHLVGGTGSQSYEVALKSDLIPSGNTAPGYEGNPASPHHGGLLQMGSQVGEVLTAHTIATIQFYSKDPQVTLIDVGDDSDPLNDVSIPFNVHAEMRVEPEANIENIQTNTFGYGHTAMPDNNGTCSITTDGAQSGSTITTQSACEAQLVSGETEVYGEWTADPNNQNVYYQKDASINFYTGRQTQLSNRFGFMHDGSLMLTSQDWSTFTDREPGAVANYIKILAHKPDNSLYYYTKVGNDDIKKRIISSATTTALGETVIFNNVTSSAITGDTLEGTTITGTTITGDTINGDTINATILKINGVEVDLDNLITEFDYWSDPTNAFTVTNTETSFDQQTSEATGQITIPALGGLLPADATLLDVVVLLRWRLTSNSDSENDNSLDSGTVQLKHGSTVYNLLAGNGTSSFSFLDGSYYTPADASASGDMIIRTCDIGNSGALATFRDYMDGQTATFYLLLNDMKSNFNNLILRDFSWGIRLYWR